MELGYDLIGRHFIAIDFDADASDTDYSPVGVVEGFAQDPRLGRVVLVRHGDDYLERIAEHLFPVIYRQVL